MRFLFRLARRLRRLLQRAQTAQTARSAQPARPAATAGRMGFFRLEERRMLSMSVGPADWPADHALFVEQIDGQLHVLDSTGHDVVPPQPFDGLQLVVHGTDQSDSLTLDFTHGTPIPAGGIEFDGHDQLSGPGDSLVIAHNPPFDHAEYHFSGPGPQGFEGSLTLDGAKIAFHGLEQTHGGDSRHTTFHLSDLPGTPNADVHLEDSAEPGHLEITASALPTTTVPYPSEQLTVHLGNQGDDLKLALGSADFHGQMEVFGGDGDDHFHVTAAGLHGGLHIDGGGGIDDIALDAALSLKNLDLDADTIHLPDGPIHVVGDVRIVVDGDHENLAIDHSIVSDAGNIELQSVHGDVLLHAAVQGGGEHIYLWAGGQILMSDTLDAGGKIALAAGGITAESSSVVDSNGHDIVLTADSLTLNGLMRSTGAATDESLFILPLSATTTIGLGDNAGGDLHLGQAALNGISGFSNLVLGQDAIQQGDITINQTGGLTLAAGLNLHLQADKAAVSISSDLALDGTLTIDGSRTTTTIGGDIVTSGDEVTLHDNVILAADVMIDTTNNNGVPAGAAILIDGSVARDVTARALTLRSGDGTTDVTGAIGSGSASLGALILQDVAGASGDVTLRGAIYAASIATGTGDHAVNLYGSVQTSGAATFTNSGTVRFGDTGGDSFAFSGGVTHTLGANEIHGDITCSTGAIDLDNDTAGTTILGNSTLAAGGKSIGLGKTTIADSTTLTLGSGGSGGVTVASLAGTAGGAANSSNVTFNVGGAVAVTGSVGTDFGLLKIENSGGATFGGPVTVHDLTITDTTDGQAVAFNGNLNVSTAMLVEANGAYNIGITGATNSIAGATVFNNAGTVTLGDAAGDSTTFVGGATITEASSIHLAGTVAASSGTIALTLGDNNTAVSVTGNALIGGAATGAIGLGDVSLADGKQLTIGMGINNTVNLRGVLGIANGGAEALVLNTTGAATVAGAIGSGANPLDQLTITQSGGTAFQGPVDVKNLAIADTADAQTVRFEGNLTVRTGMTVAAGGGYHLSMTGTTNSIAGTTVFNNAGTLTLGDAAGDSTTFVGGATITEASSIHLAGTVAASSGTSALTLGDNNTAVAVTDNALIGGAASGAIGLGDVTLADGKQLTVGTGIGNAVNLRGVMGILGGPAETLFLDTTGVVTVGSAVGAIGNPLGQLTITQSGGTTFQSAVDVQNLTITDTADGATVSFQGNPTVRTGMTVAAGGGYHVSITGTTNSIAGTTTFYNTGTLTLGDAAGDSTTFVGGLIVSNPSSVSLAGTIAATNREINIASAGTLTADTTFNSGSAATTLSGGLGGSGGLAKEGTGTLTLSGTSTYRGATTVDNGTLAINGSVTSNITVNGSGTLHGTGTIYGNVLGAGKFSPGNSATGVMTINGGFTPVGEVIFEVNHAWTIAGANHDQYVVRGAVDLSRATLTFVNTSDVNPPPVNAMLTLISHAADATTPSVRPTGGSTVPVGLRSFKIFYNGGDGNDVVLVEGSLPGTVYVDDSFRQNAGQVIADADHGTNSDQAAIYGVSAFATIKDAQKALASGGTLVVNDGTYAETASLDDGLTLRVTGPDASQTVTIGALETAVGTTVTIQGTSSLIVGDNTDRTINGLINGTGSLTKQGSGVLTLAGAVGSGTALNSLTQSAGAGLLTLAANTTVGAGGATLHENVAISGGATLTSGGNVAFGTSATNTLALNGIVKTDGGSVTVHSTTIVSGSSTIDTDLGDDGTGGAIDLQAVHAAATGYTLTLDARGSVNGGAVALGKVDNNAGADAFLGALDVKTNGTGQIHLSQDIQIGATAGANTIALSGAVVLTGNVALTTGGGDGDDITIADTIDGREKNLSITAGRANVHLAGTVGSGADPLGTFTIVSGNQVDLKQTVTSSTIAITAANAVNVASLDSTGTITISANQDGSGDEGFTQAASSTASSSIRTTNTSDAAVSITVNTIAGGTGNATLRQITTGNGGTITVQSHRGSIVQASGGLAVGPGTVDLATDSAAAAGIGASDANIQTTAGTVKAAAGSLGVFITESDDAAFTATATGAGPVSIANNAHTLKIAGPSGTNTGAVVLSSADEVVIGNTLTTTGPGGTIAVKAGGDIVVEALLKTTADGANITLDADVDYPASGTNEADGRGGVSIAGTGRVESGGNVALTGSDLDRSVAPGRVSDASVQFEVPIGTEIDSVRIASDGGHGPGDGNQVVAAGAIALAPGAKAPSNADIVLDGKIASRALAAGSQIDISANHDLHLGIDGDVAIAAGGLGTISLTADKAVGATGGQILMSDDSHDTTVIDASAGKIALVADGNIHLGHLRTTSSERDAVTLTSTSGGIVDVDLLGLDIDASHGGLVIVAKTGVGSANAIDTNIAALSATNSGTTGNIQVNEVAAGAALDIVQVKQANASGAGNILVTAEAGTLTVLGSGSGVSTAGSGTVTLTATGATSDVVVNKAVSSIAGTIQLNAERNISTTARISGSGAAAIDLNAGNGVSQGANITSVGGIITVDATAVGIAMTDGTTTSTSGAGAIAYTANTNVALSVLSGASTVNVTATTGAIAEVLTGEGANILGTTATLSAATGIGSADDIDTNIAALDATNSGTTGNIQVNEVAAGAALDIVQAKQANASGAGNILVTVEAGTLTVLGGGTGVSTAGSGTVTLTATGATSDVVVNKGITTVGGAVDINADRDVTSTVGGSITTTAATNSGVASGAVEIVAGRNVSLAGNVMTTGAAGTAKVGAGGQVDIRTTDGWIAVANITASGGAGTGIAGGAAAAIHLTSGDAGADAAQDITVGLLTALGGTGTPAGSDAAVTLSADGGLVDGDAGAGLDVAAGALTIDAKTGVGSSNPIETTVASLDVHNTASENIKIAETDAVDVNRLAQDGPGAVALMAGGAIALVSGQSGVTATTGNVLLEARGGDGDVLLNADVSSGSGHITLMAGADIIQNADIVTTAPGTAYLLAASDVRMADGTVTRTHGGAIRVAATTGNVTLGLLDTVDRDVAAGAVSVSAGGSILNEGTSFSDLNVQTGRLRMVASGGTIGAAGNQGVNIQVQTLAASSASGIYIHESDDITIGATGEITVYRTEFIFPSTQIKDASLEDLTTTQNGPIKLVAEAGTITVNGGTDAAGVSAHDAGDVLLEARGAGSDVAINASVTSGSGHLTLMAGDDLRVSAPVATAGKGTLYFHSGSGTVDAVSPNVDGITVSAAVQTEEGNMLLRSDQNIRQTAAIVTRWGQVAMDAAKGVMQEAGGNITTNANVVVQAGADWTMAGGATITLWGGRMLGKAGGTIALGRIVLDNPTENRIALTAKGELLDGNGDANNIEESQPAAATSAILRAVGRIGSQTDPLDLRVDVLTATATGMSLRETGRSLTIEAVPALTVDIPSVTQVQADGATLLAAQSVVVPGGEDLTASNGVIALHVDNGTLLIAGGSDTLGVQAEGVGNVELAAQGIQQQGAIDATGNVNLVSSPGGIEIAQGIRAGGDVNLVSSHGGIEIAQGIRAGGNIAVHSDDKLVLAAPVETTGGGTSAKFYVPEASKLVFAGGTVTTATGKVSGLFPPTVRAIPIAPGSEFQIGDDWVGRFSAEIPDPQGKNFYIGAWWLAGKPDVKVEDYPPAINSLSLGNGTGVKDPQSQRVYYNGVIEHRFGHQYDYGNALLDLGDPSRSVPVKVTVAFDPRIDKTTNKLKGYGIEFYAGENKIQFDTYLEFKPTAVATARQPYVPPPPRRVLVVESEPPPPEPLPPPPLEAPTDDPPVLLPPVENAETLRTVMFLRVQENGQTEELHRFQEDPTGDLAALYRRFSQIKLPPGHYRIVVSQAEMAMPVADFIWSGPPAEPDSAPADHNSSPEDHGGSGEGEEGAGPADDGSERSPAESLGAIGSVVGGLGGLGWLARRRKTRVVPEPPPADPARKLRQ